MKRNTHHSSFTTHHSSLVPRLRFPEFRDAEPWEVKRLGEVAKLKNGYAFPSSRYTVDGTFQIITIANVQHGRLALDSSKRISILPNDIQKHQILKLGDILISMTGNVGRVCRVDQPGLLLNQRVGKFELLNTNSINSDFLYQSLLREQFRKAMESKAVGGAQGNLSNGDILSYAFVIPIDPKEQQKIADCLSSLDELIELQAKKLDALKAHKKGLMQQLFPREGETTPRLRFPEFRNAGPWEIRTIEDIAEKIAQGGTPDTTVPEFWNGEIPWITPAEMGDDALHHYTKQTVRALSTIGLQNSSAEIMPAYSVIVSSRAPIGYVTINTVPMATNQGCKGIVPKQQIYHEFLYYSLLRAKRQLNDLGAGAGFKEISASSLKKLKILMPERAEQQKIADCLSSLDELIQLEAKKLEALKAQKKGLMQQLFPQEISA